MPTEIKWTTVYADQHGRAMLDRIDVPGGAIYVVYDEPNGKIIGTAFVPAVPDGADAQHHVCGHGYAARTCGVCNRDGMFS